MKKTIITRLGLTLISFLPALSYAGSLSTSLSTSTLTIDPSLVLSVGSGGSSGSSGSGGDSGSGGSGGTSSYTFYSSPLTATLVDTPTTIAVDPSASTTILSSGTGGSSTTSATHLIVDAPPVITIDPALTKTITVSGSGGDAATSGTGGASGAGITDKTSSTIDPISSIPVDTTGTTTPQDSLSSLSLTQTVISAVVDTTKSVIDYILPPTAPTLDPTTGNTGNTTTPIQVLTTEVPAPTTKDTTLTTPTDTTPLTTQTPPADLKPAPDQTIVDTVITAAKTVISDIVKLVSPPATDTTTSPFTTDFCYRYPLLDTCSACLSSGQAQEKMNYLNQELLNNGVDTMKYGVKFDWDLRSGKLITINLPDATEGSTVLSFNLCETTSAETCNIPIRENVDNRVIQQTTLDSLAIFSYLHPEQANKTITICNTLTNCAANLTTLSNGFFGLSMKIETKDTLCEPFYHGTILERIAADPTNTTVTCLFEIPVCQTSEQTKDIIPSPTPAPTTPAPVKAPIVDPIPVVKAPDPVVDPEPAPQPATEPATPTATTPQNICTDNPYDPSCFGCLTIQEAKESLNWVNQIILSMPAPQPDPMTITFDWSTGTGKISAPASSDKFSSFLFQVCDRPEAMCTSAPLVTPDLTYISSNGINSILLYSSINAYQAEKIISICNTMAKPAGSCYAELITEATGSQYVRIKAVTVKEACIPAFGGNILEGPDSNGDYTCLFKKPLCSIAAPKTPDTLATEPQTTVPETPKTPTSLETTPAEKIIPPTITLPETPAAIETPTPLSSNTSNPAPIVHEAPEVSTPKKAEEPTSQHPFAFIPPSIEAPIPEAMKKTSEESHATPSTDTSKTDKPATTSAPKKSAIIVIFCEEGSQHGFYIDENGNKKDVAMKDNCPSAGITDNDQSMAERKEITDYIGAPTVLEQKANIKKRVKKKIDTILENPEKKVDITIIQKENPPVETKAPEAKAPDTQVSETKSPETKSPETKPSETKAPETQISETLQLEKVQQLDGFLVKERIERDYERVSDDVLISKKANASLLPVETEREKTKEPAKTFNELLISEKIGALSLSAPSSLTTPSSIDQTAAIIQPYPAALETTGGGCGLRK
ncbi:MAG: hypothetical protein IPJ69_05335 [Deltaproteobacteria bacterium]|nr:MAG: hypothetical protein IPJ69_05335 [Deltaproteobacteria bacterium]